MGFNPINWGSSYWTMIHMTALYYGVPGVKNEKEFEKFFESLPHLLPCPGCGVHCIEYMTLHPPPIIGTCGTDALFNWTVDFHNAVTERTRKGTQITHEQAKKIYMDIFNDTTGEALKKQKDRIAEGHLIQDFKDRLESEYKSKLDVCEEQSQKITIALWVGLALTILIAILVSYLTFFR